MPAAEALKAGSKEAELTMAQSVRLETAPGGCILHNGDEVIFYKLAA